MKSQIQFRSCLAFLGWVSVLLLSGCGKTLALGEYTWAVNAFEQAAKDQGRPLVVDDLIIEVSQDLDYRVAGECVTGTFLTPTIRLNKIWVESSDRDYLKLLIFHELGHCVLGREHHMERLRSGSPESIMYPASVSLRQFKKEENYYMAELFQAKSKKQILQERAVSSAATPNQHWSCSHGH